MRAATRLVALLVFAGILSPAAESAGQSNPAGYSISGPGSVRRCSTIQVSVTPSSGGALWDEIWWPGFRLERGSTENKSTSGGGSWDLDTWHNGALWFCSGCPRGTATLELTAIAAAGTPNTGVWVGYGWNGTHRNLEFGTHQTIEITPGSGATTPSLTAFPKSLPANGTSTASVTARFVDVNCKGISGISVGLGTTLGRLRLGQQEGTSVVGTTNASGSVTATLVAATTSGVASVTASSASGSASTSVPMKGPQLTLSALPVQLPADGHTPSLLTANLLDGDGAPVSGATIEFFTDKGGLIVPPDPSGIGVPGVTAATGASGDARVELLPMTAKPVPSSEITPVAVGDTVTVTASYGSGETKVTATASVAIVGYTLDLTLGQAKFQRVANVAPGGFQQDVYGGGSNGGPAAATKFGTASVGVRAKLSLGGVPVPGKRVLLGSSQALVAGASHVRFEQPGSSTQVTEVTTDANGEASFDVVVQDAWRAPVALPFVDITAELADDASVKAGAFRVDVKDNLTELLTRYQSTAGVQSGPVMSVELDHDLQAWHVPADYQKLMLLRPGIRNDMLAGGAFKPLLGQDRVDQCLRHTAPYYQREVLAFMHGLQWSHLTSPTDARWLLNGLDWGPLFVEGTFHLAAVLYPRTDLGKTEAEWGPTAEFARVLDPWIEQRATFYTWPEWMSQLADPSLRVGVPSQPAVVRAQTKEFVDGQFGGTATPSHFYPANRWNYYRSDETVPEPFTDEQRTNWIQMLVDGYRMIFNCPVRVTLTDGQGRATGFVAGTGGGIARLVAQAPGVLADAVRKPDGTIQWSLLAGAGPYTVTIEAYGDGPFSATLVPPGSGKIWEYTTTLQAGDRATLQIDRAATTPAALTLAGGRGVDATVRPLFKAGVYPSTSLVMGGGEAVVTGIDIAEGASITIGGVATTQVTRLNGTTARVTVPRGTAGTQDVTVTNPGQEPRTISQAFSYEYVKRYFAEGATGDLFDTRFALLNPSDRQATATLHFQRGDGQVVDWPVMVGARSRATVDARDVPGMATAEFATAIDADELLVVDRTMRWSRSGTQAGYGAHAERSVVAPSPVWYLAEGATHSGFDLFYLIQNPNTTDVNVEVKYLRPAPAAPVTKSYAIGPRRRFNIWVNAEGQDLAATDVSAILTSTTGAPIIVERALYLTSAGRLFNAGHESAGVTAPATEWFLAEGATGDYFDLFILVANPTGTDASVEARFLLPDGTVHTKQYAVAANSRFNIWADMEEIPAGSGARPLADTAVSTTISSLNHVPIIVERAMWWPGAFASWAEAHNSPGSTESGVEWGLAEGEATNDAAHHETFILVANATARSGAARVTLLFEDGTSQSKTYPLAASSRTNVWVNADFPEAMNRRFGAIVESLAPDGGGAPAQIVVERAMYANAGGMNWAAGTNALATRIR